MRGIPLLIAALIITSSIAMCQVAEWGFARYPKMWDVGEPPPCSVTIIQLYNCTIVTLAKAAFPSFSLAASACNIGRILLANRKEVEREEEKRPLWLDANGEPASGRKMAHWVIQLPPHQARQYFSTPLSLPLVHTGAVPVAHGVAQKPFRR